MWQHTAPQHCGEHCNAALVQELGLGPNGGLLYCMDYLQKNLDWLQQALAPLEQGERACRAASGGTSPVLATLTAGACCVCCAANTYILFDLPGQVELFTLHPSFRDIITTLTDKWAYRLVAVHLVDAHLCTDASKCVLDILSFFLSIFLSTFLGESHAVKRCTLLNLRALT